MTKHDELLTAITSAAKHKGNTGDLERVRDLLPHYDTIKAPDHDTSFKYSRVWHKLNDRKYSEVIEDDLCLVSAVSKFSRADIVRDENLELDLLRNLRGDLPAPPDCDERQRVFHSTNLVDAGYAEGVSTSNGGYVFNFELLKITSEGVKRLEDTTRQDSDNTATRNQSSHSATIPKPLKLFISHSSSDVDVAKALIDLLRVSLNLEAQDIRCTSVDGYRLPAGVSTDEQLRLEVDESATFIGLISDKSMASPYVVFELGARWGAGRQLIPLLAPGTSAKKLGGPLQGINALSCERTGQIYQLVSDLGEALGMQPSPVSNYQREVEQLRNCRSIRD